MSFTKRKTPKEILDKYETYYERQDSSKEATVMVKKSVKSSRD